MATDKGVPVPGFDAAISATADSVPQTATVNDVTLQSAKVQSQQNCGSEPQRFECDVLVVGAGFSGITAIHRFRKAGMNVKCFEAGDGFGGVWHWNRYPGARVDSEMPFYQLNIPEVYKTWSFSERFPDHRELRRYMAHVDKVLHLSKDVFFNSKVVDASWNQQTARWTVKTQQGHTASSKYLLLASGLLHRTYTPDFQGLKDYKGEVYHSGSFPENYSAKGKKVALIGAGATGVQITQELGKQADHLTVLLRSPSTCYAMKQRKWTEEDRKIWQPFFPIIFQGARDSYSGFSHEPPLCGAFEVSVAEREAWFEEVWERGGFHFALSNYRDIPVEPKANRLAYNFWRKKVCARLTDPKKQAIMAPEEPPYYIGTKRAPLEHDYYDVLNQPNVEPLDLKANPLKGFYEKGLLMDDGTQLEADTVIFATGFDSYTGALTNMGLKDTHGKSLAEHWKDGIHTYMGLMVSGFPNMFMSYSPQAPNALANGPTVIELQIDLIADMVVKLEKENAKTIEPKQEAEAAWKAQIEAVMAMTLIPTTNSWWNGSNVPGKKSEAMTYVGGNAAWEKQCRTLIPEWSGFEIVAA